MILKKIISKTDIKPLTRKGIMIINNQLIDHLKKMKDIKDIKGVYKENKFVYNHLVKCNGKCD